MATPPPFGQPLSDGKYHPKNFPFELTKEAFIEIHTTARVLFEQLSALYPGFMRAYPVIHVTTDIKSLINNLLEMQYKEDMTLSTSLNPLFISMLMYYGFLPLAMAHPDSNPSHIYKYQWLMPKIHRMRTVMDWKKYSPPNHTLKKQSKKFFFTINQSFDGVIQGCVNQHGDSWLYPAYRDVLQNMFDTNHQRHVVKMVSIEVWLALEDFEVEMQQNNIKNNRKPSTEIWNIDDPGYEEEMNDRKLRKYTPLDATVAKHEHRREKFAQTQKERRLSGIVCSDQSDQNPLEIASNSLKYGPNYYLVAGEIGYTCNSQYYCSMTGFRNFWVDSAGTAQLHALACFLRYSGVELWDLGMMMTYKKDLGAREITRRHFLTYLKGINEAAEKMGGIGDKIGESEKVEEKGKGEETNEETNEEKVEKVEKIEENEKLRKNNAIINIIPHSLVNNEEITMLHNYSLMVQDNYTKLHQDEKKDDKSDKSQHQYEKKLRWLAKKYGQNSQEMVDYKNSKLKKIDEKSEEKSEEKKRTESRTTSRS